MNQKLIVFRFVSERKRQVVIEQTRFLSTVFLCSECKLENIFSGVNFCGKNVCGNFYLGEPGGPWRELINRKAIYLLSPPWQTGYQRLFKGHAIENGG